MSTISEGSTRYLLLANVYFTVNFSSLLYESIIVNNERMMTSHEQQLLNCCNFGN